MKYLRIHPLGLSVALSLFGDLSLFAGLVTQLQAVNLSLADVGVILSVHRLVRIPGNLVVGHLQDRVGRRPLFVLGMALAVVSTAGYGLVSGFWPFVLMRVVWGAAWALINVCGTTLVLDMSTERDRGRLMGMLSAWIWVGYAVGPVVGGLLTEALSFQRAMLICAAISAIGLAVSILFVRGARLVPTSQPQKFNLIDAFRQSLDFRRNAPLLNRTLMTFAVVQFAGDGVLMATLTLLLSQRLGPVIQIGSLQLDAAAAGGIFIAGRAVLAGLVALGAGRLSDSDVGRPRLVRAGLILAAAGMGVLALANSTGWILLGLAVSSVASGILMSLLPALVRDHTTPSELGRSLGAYAMIGDIGSTAGPAAAFALAPLVGLAPGYWMCVALFIGGFLLFR